MAGDRVALTDVEATPWADRAVDALALPYEDGTVANRYWRPDGRGRALLLAASTPLYRRFHEDRTELEVDPFIPDPAIAEAPFESNQALPTLAFYRRRDELARRWPALRLFEERRLAFVLYPLSRGFSKPPLVPAVLVSPLELLERLLRPLAPLLAIRCLVVLEKRV